MSLIGTKLPTWDVLATVATGGSSDMTRGAQSVVNDPRRTCRLSATQGPNFHEPFFALTE
jgi:hypothetical protein